MGSLKAVSQLVRDAALSYSEGVHKNCSDFVSQHLRASLDEKATVNETRMAENGPGEPRGNR